MIGDLKCPVRSDDYVKQGDDRFYFPADGVTANVKTNLCSCRNSSETYIHDCEHIRIAKVITAIDKAQRAARAGRLTTNKKSELCELLKDTDIQLNNHEEQEELKKLMFEYLFFCDECNRWRDIDDENLEIQGICEDCLR